MSSSDTHTHTDSRTSETRTRCCKCQQSAGKSNESLMSCCCRCHCGCRCTFTVAQLPLLWGVACGRCVWHTPPGATQVACIIIKSRGTLSCLSASISPPNIAVWAGQPNLLVFFPLSACGGSKTKQNTKRNEKRNEKRSQGKSYYLFSHSFVSFPRMKSLR